MFSGIVIFCFYSFIRLKELLPVEEYGYDAVFFILLILCFAWGGDTCAYFAGRAFGKHKLCPVVSPKKTVEGAIGGVLGTMVFGVLITVIYSIAADRMEEFTRSNIGISMYVIIALLACVAAVLGIYGDLFASVVKRQCGIKDYGTIFPGHGGILDRFDSVMFIAPFVTMVVIAAFYQLKSAGDRFFMAKKSRCWALPAPSAPRVSMSSALRGMRCSACRLTARRIKFCSR